MKKMITIIALSLSFSALADSSACKTVYSNHFERLDLIKTLMISGEISPSFAEARLQDEDEMMETLEPIMCKGISKEKREKLKLKALAEVSKI